MDILENTNANKFEHEISELKNALNNTKNIRLYKPYSILIEHFYGFTNKEIAQLEDIDEHTVGIYIKNYKSKGLAGLNIAHGGGSVKKINN